MIARGPLLVLVLAVAAGAAGACRLPRVWPKPPPPEPAATATEIVPIRDPEMARRLTDLELRLLEKETQIAELQARLDEARREVVRAMAKLQTLATRAEAASAMAEAEIALQAVRLATGPEVTQARQLLQMSAGEFDRQNYGGALYLATQAKTLAAFGRWAMGDGGPSLRPGETPFALPIPLRCTTQSNVREGPGTNFRVVFTVEQGTPVVGHSHVGEWVRIRDDSGRAGWVHLSLVGRRTPT